MKVMITGRHMEMTDALKAYVENSLGKVKAHFDKVIDVDVVLDIEKHRHIAEVNLHANGIRIHSRESSSDMYASVDSVIDKIEKQVRKYKDRIIKHKPRHAKEERGYDHSIIEVEAELAAVAEAAVAAGTEETLRHRVIKEEMRPIKPMTVDEAVMQLELVEEPFLVFLNVATDQVNVLYKRGQDMFGLFGPQKLEN